MDKLNHLLDLPEFEVGDQFEYEHLRSPVIILEVGEVFTRADIGHYYILNQVNGHGLLNIPESKLKLLKRIEKSDG